MHGEEVLRRLWEDDRTRAIPVAVLSADATPAQAKRLLAAGASAYLTKPLDIGELLQLVDEKLKKRPSQGGSADTCILSTAKAADRQ
jgi:CheY-like chemotaxis protein